MSPEKRDEDSYRSLCHSAVVLTHLRPLLSRNHSVSLHRQAGPAEEKQTVACEAAACGSQHNQEAPQPRPLSGPVHVTCTLMMCTWGHSAHWSLSWLQ